MSLIFLSLIFLTVFGHEVHCRPPSKILGPSSPVCSGQRPYQVSLWTKLSPKQKMFYFCGGTILDSKHILTAAHCVHNNKFLGIWVVAGCVDFSDSERTLTSVARSDVHGEFAYAGDRERPYIMNDIAILTIYPPLPLGKSVKPLKLPKRNVESGMTGVVAGWGNESPGNTTDLSQLLLGANMKIMKPELCGREIPETQFCAIDEKKRNTVSWGDSGSPFVVADTVVGIVSSGWQLVDYPLYFTNIFSYVDFIAKIVGQTTYDHDDTNYGLVNDVVLMEEFTNRH